VQVKLEVGIPRRGNARGDAASMELKGFLTGVIKSQLVRADDVTKPGGAPAQSCIKGDKPAFEQPS
jgi:hypothetical protein